MLMNLQLYMVNSNGWVYTWYSKHSGDGNSGSQANLIAFNNVTKKVMDTINAIAMDDISVAQPAASGVSGTIGATTMDLGHWAVL